MRWKKGSPPKDGNPYEMRRRFRVSWAKGPQSPYVWKTVVFTRMGWWNGKSYVEWNQFSGGERYLFGPDEWRPMSSEFKEFWELIGS